MRQNARGPRSVMWNRLSDAVDDRGVKDSTAIFGARHEKVKFAESGMLELLYGRMVMESLWGAKGEYEGFGTVYLTS
ncbi:MAG TPA: hypothetical protein VFH31_04375 [Pyrinomonadaceae bacterium]|nr:hypothetical protein [Pyrinomonadaceae bacterium]